MNKQYLKIVIPTMISYVLSSMYSIIDGLFIGKVAGDDGLAAVNIAWPIPALIVGIGVWIGTGGSILLSHHKGQDDQKYQNHTISLLIVAALTCMIFCFLFCEPILRMLQAEGTILKYASAYCRVLALGCIFQITATGMLSVLRNMRLSLEAMIVMMIGIISNIILNFPYLFVFHLGIAGTALGTVSAQCIIFCGCMYLYLGKAKQKFKFHLDKHLIKETMIHGFAAFGISIAPTINLTLTNFECLALQGSSAVACYAAISYITFPVQNIMAGIQEGMQPLLSYYNGRNEIDKLKKLEKTGFGISIALAIILTCLCIIFKEHIASAFSLSKTAAELFSNGMFISALSFIFIAIDKFNIGRLNATFRSSLASQLIYLESLLIGPLLIFILPKLFSFNGLWASLGLAPLITLIIYYIVNHIRR